MGKSLLILGATINQLPFVLCAKKRLIHTVTLDNVPHNICHKYSDEQVFISTLDKATILKFVKEHHIDGIVTCASDIALPTVAYVCNILNLPSVNYSSVLTTINKKRFRAFQRLHKLEYPRYFTFTSPEDAIAKINILFGKWVVKPVDSSGSKGIALIDCSANISSIRTLIRDAFRFSRSKTVIIEEYTEGANCSVDGFIYNGKIEQLYITNKSLTPFPNLTPISHTLPSDLPLIIQNKIKKKIEIILGLLKTITSPFDFDIVVSSTGEIVILEMSLRIGGNGIPRLIEYAGGNNLYDMAISQALSERIPRQEKTKSSNYTGVFLIRSHRAGILTAMTDTKTMLSKYNSHLKEVVYDVALGDKVEKFTQGNHRLGHFVIQAKSANLLAQLSDQIHQDLNMIITPISSSAI